MLFIDKAKIHLQAGKGGAGAISFRREKYIEFGGPNGGNGGNGGSIYIEASSSINTLIDYRYRQHYKAEFGSPGMNKNKNGSDGADMILYVPLGTKILDSSGEYEIYDLVEEGSRVLLAEGTIGGKGNAFFKSSTNKAPRISQKPDFPELVIVWLKLSIIADVGILGKPNAGKSTLINRISNSKSKIANYEFTTITPQLGSVTYNNYHFTVADLPGLIKNAAEGKGLGIQFLNHAKRTKVLLHVIDINKDVITEYKDIMHELEVFDEGLYNKVQIVILNKTDCISEEKTKEKQLALKEATGVNAICTSLALNNNLDHLMAAIVAELKSQEPEKTEKDAYSPV